MRKEDLNQTDDMVITQKLEEAFGYSDQQLFEEFEQAAAQAAEHPDPQLTPPEDEFQKIMARVEADKAAEKKVLRLKKVMKPLLVAAALGTVVLGTGIGVSGKREFEYWVREKDGGEVVFNNVDGFGEEEKAKSAYEQIGKQLGIEVLELVYLPSGTKYSDLNIVNGVARMEFKYENGFIHFYQILMEKDNSADYISDRTTYKTIYNRYLDKNISIYKNKLEDNLLEFSAQFINDKAYYYLSGVMSEEEFKKVVKNIQFFLN